MGVAVPAKPLLGSIAIMMTILWRQAIPLAVLIATFTAPFHLADWAITSIEQSYTATPSNVSTTVDPLRTKLESSDGGAYLDTPTTANSVPVPDVISTPSEASNSSEKPLLERKLESSDGDAYLDTTTTANNVPVPDVMSTTSEASNSSKPPLLAASESSGETHSMITIELSTIVMNRTADMKHHKKLNKIIKEIQRTLKERSASGTINGEGDESSNLNGNRRDRVGSKEDKVSPPPLQPPVNRPVEIKLLILVRNLIQFILNEIRPALLWPACLYMAASHMANEQARVPTWGTIAAVRRSWKANIIIMMVNLIAFTGFGMLSAIAYVIYLSATWTIGLPFYPKKAAIAMEEALKLQKEGVVNNEKFWRALVPAIIAQGPLWTAMQAAPLLVAAVVFLWLWARWTFNLCVSSMDPAVGSMASFMRSSELVGGVCLQLWLWQFGRMLDAAIEMEYIENPLLLLWKVPILERALSVLILDRGWFKSLVVDVCQLLLEVIMTTTMTVLYIRQRCIHESVYGEEAISAFVRGC